MDVLIKTALNAVWPQICKSQNLYTPDASAGKSFAVVSSDQDSISITTEGGFPLRIQREAFFTALLYLVTHHHSQDSPCEIRSNQLAENAGPLCRATREVNSGTRVINYIAPILVTTGLVVIRSSRPNAVWLA
jgi:hypothetical protein